MPSLRVSSTITSRPPRASGLDYSLCLELRDHCSIEPLRRGHGILFARGVRESEFDTREARGLLDPSVAIDGDERLHIVSRRVDTVEQRTDAIVLSTYEIGGYFSTIEWHVRDLGGTPSLRNPVLDFSNEIPRLHWLDDDVDRYINLAPDLRTILGQPMSGQSRAPVLEVEIGDTLATELRNSLGVVHAVKTEPLDDAVASVSFSDGSTAVRPLRNGGVAPGARAFPFIVGRADPSLVQWRGQWLFIATDEYYAEHPATSGLLIRAADSIELLPEAKDHRILGPGGELGGCFWAPELHEIGGRLRCLFAPSIGTAEWTEVQCWVMTLEHDGDPTEAADWSPPLPVLTREGSPLQLDEAHPGISLDMTFFRAAARSYFVWSQRFTKPTLGDAELWLADVSEDDPTRLLSAPVRIASPEYSWEIDGANVAEAPFAVIRDSMIYLTYSASGVGPTYAVGLLKADLDAELLDPASWGKSPFPVLDSDVDEGQWGPGHSMFARDADGVDILVYHALSERGGQVRDSGLRPVHFGANGRLVLDMRLDEEAGVAMAGGESQ